MSLLWFWIIRYHIRPSEDHKYLVGTPEHHNMLIRPWYFTNQRRQIGSIGGPLIIGRKVSKNNPPPELLI